MHLWGFVCGVCMGMDVGPQGYVCVCVLCVCESVHTHFSVPEGLP